MLRTVIFSHKANQLHVRVQRREVSRHVRRTTGHKTLGFKLHNRHRCFRRDAIHSPPKELVQHDIAHHQQAIVIGGETQASIGLFVAGVAGGLGSLLGAAIGALYWWGGLWWLPGNWSLLATGGGVLVVLLVLPGGLAGGLYELRDAALRRVAERHGIHAPGFTPDREQSTDPEGLS